MEVRINIFGEVILESRKEGNGLKETNRKTAIQYLEETYHLWEEELRPVFLESDKKFCALSARI